MTEKRVNNDLEPPSDDSGHLNKRIKIDGFADEDLPTVRETRKGVAPVKSEYLLPHQQVAQSLDLDDDRAEAAPHVDGTKDNTGRSNDGGQSKRKKQRGQNRNRHHLRKTPLKQLCASRASSSELSPAQCPWGDACRSEHDLRKFLSEQPQDPDAFGRKCPNYEARGWCNYGWKCLFVKSHSEEKTHPDGKQELILLGQQPPTPADEIDARFWNLVSNEAKINLSRRRTKAPKSDSYAIQEQHASAEPTKDPIPESDGQTESNGGKVSGDASTMPLPSRNSGAEGDAVDGDAANGAAVDTRDVREGKRAAYCESRFLPSEKRRLYFGPETPVLAPLTTQGNLPFRQLCVSLGAQITYSEMAVSASIMQGKKPEWALMKAHQSEAEAPQVHDPAMKSLLAGNDTRFGVQIAASKPLMAWQATEMITNFCPKIRVVDLNCGCPIDLIFQSGGGSALLAAPAKLRRVLQGMSAVSGETPISVKLRMGVADSKPVADKIINKLLERPENGLHHLGGSTGVAAITLHGRSRQQRYTKAADWSYIASCSALIKQYHRQDAEVRDTVREVDDRQLPSRREPYFIGNGDVYSHVDYQEHIEKAGVDSVMIARGALVKPWIFEEVVTGQYLDKSANERLDYIRTFAHNGLAYWGTDTMGLQNTRRFLLEWLSFAYRYVPIGLLERLPPRLQDRPPRFCGRNELETLMASPDSRDWIKISEMVLGPCDEGFDFKPKHKSNSYEGEAEG